MVDEAVAAAAAAPARERRSSPADGCAARRRPSRWSASASPPYLTIVHYTGAAPACAIAHGCEVVQSSAYAKLGGIPVALLGLLGYAAILVTLLRDDETARTATALLALGGAGFSAWLTYVEVARLDAICIWCVGSAICMVLLAGLSVARLLSAPAPRPTGPRA